MPHFTQKSYIPIIGIFATLLLITGPVCAQTVGGGYDTLYEYGGGGNQDNFGIAVSGAGDLNNDGFDDFIVGASSADPRGRLNAGAVYAYSGADGSLLFQWNGEAKEDFFGSRVSGAGDVNHDGYDDVIIGAPRASPANKWRAGSVYVYSGADGTLLFQWDGMASSEFFGRSVSSAGDVNADGFDDLVFGAISTGAGSAYVYSGMDGSRLFRWDGQNRLSVFGSSVSGAGDINKDGFDDLIVGARGFLTDGSAYIFSGKDGQPLHRWDGPGNGGFGGAVSGAGDVNADGFLDLVVGAAYAEVGGLKEAGSVFVYSGADFSLLFRWNGGAKFDHFGGTVSDAGDVNGDGFADLIVGAVDADPDGLKKAGSAYVFSGADGQLLYQWDGEEEFDGFGSTSGAGDVNGDGLGDLIVGAFLASPTGPIRTGSATVYSFRPFLQASDTQISIATGGTIELQLDFPASAAGNSYIVLASRSGVGPIYYGVEIPLTDDPLLRLTWSGLYPGAQEGRLHGTLDVYGMATATLRITAGNWLELIGMDFHFAAVAMPAGGLPEFSSVAVPISILP
jgi:FG-GAP repeat protein